MGSNEYGYIGDTPTQSSSSNNGVFGSDSVTVFTAGTDTISFS